uniref:Delta-aminolevulinic acid dehydratase n=1 Tax=mine drainage metagenome TaxID=410659 RepID=E6PCY7_9ZZZZ
MLHRPRRLRRTPALRSLVREHRTPVDALVMPLFVVERESDAGAISSMPGVFRSTLSQCVEESKRLYALGVNAVLLFGIPAHKDAVASRNAAEDGIVQRAIAAIKATTPEMLTIADLCNCEYTDHGHCGLLDERGDVRNDETVALLAEVARSYARAGVDIVAPSDMMDGRVGAIRHALDKDGFTQVGIMAYSAKYSSAFYGPFREAAGSTPQFGDRRGYQMDPPNAREAMREIALDIEEGADIVMVKPALAYLDIVRSARERFDTPIAVYNVSGEYAMMEAAFERGWLERERSIDELMAAFTRAGADIIITYFAADYARRHGRGR